MTRTPHSNHTPNQKGDNETPRKKEEPSNAISSNGGGSGYDQLDTYDYSAGEVEPFVPTDFYPSNYVRGKKRRHARRKRRALWAVLLITGILLLVVGGIFAYVLLLNPSQQFVDASATPQPFGVETMDGSEAVTTPPQVTNTPDPNLYDVISAQADTSMMQNIVNVLFIGVDYAVERETWGGKHEYHADVMMVAAINFDENRVDLISLPRDTYANIPGVKGIYKLNASLNCGGGFEAPGGAGFLKTCEAASWMLGGIPVNYYYAVTMPAVKQLVDAVGGVDYNLEMTYTMMGRRYTAGPTHLNGQGVLDYLRVRKYIDKGGDSNRVNRQKKMLIAIFKSLQEQNLILKVPEILSSFDGQLYTNCTLGQTAALTKFGYGLDGGNIGMYSMTSSNGGNTNIFNWNFCLTDQTKRVQIIKDVYGVDVPKELEYTPDYAKYRWADMIATQYLDTTAPLVEYVSAALAADELLPTATPTIEPTATPTPGEVVTPYITMAPTAEPTPSPSPSPNPTPDPAAVTSGTLSKAGDPFGAVRLSIQQQFPLRGENYRRYSDYSRQMLNDFLMSLDALEEAQSIARKEASKYAAGKSNDLAQAKQDVEDYASHVKTNALALAQEFDYPMSDLIWACRYEKDPNFNEVKVDFN